MNAIIPSTTKITTPSDAGAPGGQEQSAHPPVAFRVNLEILPTADMLRAPIWTQRASSEDAKDWRRSINKDINLMESRLT